MPAYGEFVPRQRFQPGVSLSRDGAQVAFSSNASGQFNLWVQPVSGGQARQVTDFTDRVVRRFSWTPDGSGLYFTADQDGDEQHHIYRVGLGGGFPEQVTTAESCQHELADHPFSADGRYLVYAVNDRDPELQDILIRDLESGGDRRIVSPPGIIFWPVGLSPDGRWLLTGAYRSSTDIDCLLLDLDHPEQPLACVLKGENEEFYEPVTWAVDSRAFYVRTNRGSQFAYAALYSIPDESLATVVAAAWDVEQLILSSDGRTLIWSVNEDGRSVLHARCDGRERTFPDLPQGVITAVSASADGTAAALQIDTAVRPADVGVLGLDSGVFDFLTDSRPSGLHRVTPVDPQPVCFSARDGRAIHGLAYRPQGSGRFPVVLWIHGGPHGQERPDYQRSGLYQYLLSRGIGVYGPNAAGSTGYGTALQTMIYRNWGGPDLEDFREAVTFLCDLEWVDPGRLAVAGASYGGFAALSCLARIDHPWAAGVSVCGPSNLVTLATACPPTWRAYVNRVIGDPQQDTELLKARSPMTYADQITAPLLVLQGAKDPRVPKDESDQIVQSLRERGVEVGYEIFPNEGHGFTNRDNEIRAYSQIADFLIAHLGPTGSPG